MSQRHRGASESYQHKVKVMETRQDQRALLANAKRLFYAMHPDDDHREQRYILSTLKKQVAHETGKKKPSAIEAAQAADRLISHTLNKN